MRKVIAVAMLMVGAAIARAADTTDAQVYAEARKGIADEAKPVYLKCAYLRAGEFAKFRQVLSKEARAYVEKQLAADKDFLAKLQKREKELPFDEKSTTFRVMPRAAVNQEIADFGGGENGPRIKKGIETVLLSTTTMVGNRGPEYVVKEGGLWRIAMLDGMPHSTIAENLPK